MHGSLPRSRSRFAFALPRTRGYAGRPERTSTCHSCFRCCSVASGVSQSCHARGARVSDAAARPIVAASTRSPSRCAAPAAPAAIRSAREPTACRRCFHQGREQRLEDVGGADDLRAQVTVAPRERASRIHMRAKHQVARAEARASAVGMMHHVERSVLRSLGRRRQRLMIRAAEQRLLPPIARSTREGRPAPVRQARLELALVTTVLEQRLRHRSAAGVQAIGMEIQGHTRRVRSRRQTCIRRLVIEDAHRALDYEREDLRDPRACRLPRSLSACSHVRQGPLTRRQSPRHQTLRTSAPHATHAA
jgi:hypothetical protein